MTEGTEKDPVNLDTVDFRPFFFFFTVAKYT